MSSLFNLYWLFVLRMYRSNADNCLRAVQDTKFSTASAYCSSYLAQTTTATTGLPTSLASSCQSSNLRVSSACACYLASSSFTAIIVSSLKTQVSTPSASLTTITVSSVNSQFSASPTSSASLTTIIGSSVITLFSTSSTSPSLSTTIDSSLINQVSISKGPASPASSATARATARIAPYIFIISLVSHSVVQIDIQFTQTRILVHT